MKNRLLIVCIALLAVQYIYGQSNRELNIAIDKGNRNAIYSEVFVINPSKHDFGYPSINYERFFCCMPGLSVRMGASSNFTSQISFPFSINYITHQMSKHHLELGMGTIISINDKSDAYYEDVNAFAIFMPFMYRYQQENGLVLRAGVNAMFGKNDFIAPSVSIGYKF